MWRHGVKPDRLQAVEGHPRGGRRRTRLDNRPPSNGLSLRARVRWARRIISSEKDTRTASFTALTALIHFTTRCSLPVSRNGQR